MGKLVALLHYFVKNFLKILVFLFTLLKMSENPRMCISWYFRDVQSQCNRHGSTKKKQVQENRMCCLNRVWQTKNHLITLLLRLLQIRKFYYFFPEIALHVRNPCDIAARV